MGALCCEARINNRLLSAETIEFVDCYSQNFARCVDLLIISRSVEVLDLHGSRHSIEESN